jgi:hypothetical protein
VPATCGHGAGGEAKPLIPDEATALSFSVGSQLRSSPSDPARNTASARVLTANFENYDSTSDSRVANRYRCIGFDQAERVGAQNGLGPPLDSELHEEVFDVRFDRLGRDAKPTGDLLV